ncbi:MAG: hypothetical protein K6E54_08645, partial [Bacteroidaceae bacterium]|nr:hypothetical protein [Bacteroidaceae bacterium]
MEKVLVDCNNFNLYLIHGKEKFCIFALSMRLYSKRIWSVWTLLTVFVLLQAIVALHRHEMVEQTVVECYECAHNGYHHDGHLVPGTFSLDHCVICQFYTISFLTPVAICAGVLVLYSFSCRVSS